MSFVEFIGFVISLISLFFLYFKNRLDANQRRAEELHEGNEELHEEDHSLNDFLKSLEEDMRDEHPAKRPLPPSPPHSKSMPRPARVQSQSHQVKHKDLSKHQLKSSIEERRLKSSLEERHLRSKLTEKPDETAYETYRRNLQETNFTYPEEIDRPKSRAAMLLDRLPHLRDAIIYKEIMGKPKGLDNF